MVLVCINYIKFILEKTEIRGLWNFISCAVHLEIPRDPTFDKNADHSQLVIFVTYLKELLGHSYLHPKLCMQVLNEVAGSYLSVFLH